MFTRLTTCKWWYKPWVTIARGDICYRGTNMWKILLFSTITVQLLECTLGAVCSQREKSRAGQQWTYSKLCFPWSVGINIMIKLLFSLWRSRQRKSRNGTSAVKSASFDGNLLPMFHGKHNFVLWKCRKMTKIVNAIAFSCISGQRNYNSEVSRWKSVVSGLHFLLLVFSETQSSKMSKKLAGARIEKCAKNH